MMQHFNELSKYFPTPVAIQKHQLWKPLSAHLSETRLKATSQKGQSLPSMVIKSIKFDKAVSFLLLLQYSWGNQKEI